LIGLIYIQSKLDGALSIDKKRSRRGSGAGRKIFERLGLLKGWRKIRGVGY